jgi:hypothetical protein
VVVKATVNLFEDNVFVGFDNVKLVVVFAVVSDWEFFLDSGEGEYVGDGAIAVPDCPYFIRVPTWFTSLVPAWQCILRVVYDGRMFVRSFLLQKMSVVE